MSTKGASTVKWTTLEPCIGLSASDSKVYTNFEYVKKKFIHLKKHIGNLCRQIVVQEKFTYLEDGASGVQEGNIEHAIV